MEQFAAVFDISEPQMLESLLYFLLEEDTPEALQVRVPPDRWRKGWGGKVGAVEIQGLGKWGRSLERSVCLSLDTQRKSIRY